MYVHPNYLREGIGSLIISEIVNSVSKSSCLEVSAIQESNKAIGFYKKLGFRPFKQETAEVFPNVELLVIYMECAVESIQGQSY